MPETDVHAFDRYEAAGWEFVAALYERFRSPITSQAVGALLDAAGVKAGMRVVDVGSGAGDAAARATERGARATGVDVAAAMVKIATRRCPGAASEPYLARQGPAASRPAGRPLARRPRGSGGLRS